MFLVVDGAETNVLPARCDTPKTGRSSEASSSHGAANGRVPVMFRVEEDDVVILGVRYTGPTDRY
jgi:hypothetical protein